MLTTETKNLWTGNEQVEAEIKAGGPVVEQIRRGDKYLNIGGREYYSDYIVCAGCDQIIHVDNSRK
jgi:hypothetical protein